MATTTLSYLDGDTELKGQLALGEGAGKRPGVVVFHEGSGLGPHPIESAERLAKLGYVALAADMFGGGRAAATPAEAATLMAPFQGDSALIRRRARAAIEALRTRPECDPTRVAAIGYCFGGATVLELARDGADLVAVVSFHGVLGTTAPAGAGAVRASVLVCAGFEDILASQADRAALEAELSAAGANWQLIVYGGAKHSFTNPGIDAVGLPDFRYDAGADRRSWDASVRHLREAFAISS